MSDIEPTDSAPDPLDDLLRRTMRALDAQTPEATFQALPAAVERGIDAAAASGELSDALTEEAGGGSGQERSGRRSSAQVLRAKKATTIPPAPPIAAEAPARGRAHRRSLLETQVGAPLPWWQSKMLAGATLAAAVAIAAALVVTRDEDQQQLSGSSKNIHDAALREAARRMGKSPASGPGWTEDQARLRSALAEAAADLRGCVSPRPLDGVELKVTLDGSGKLGAVEVRGEVTEAGRGCITTKLHAAPLAPMAQLANKVITIPLFE
jgi:hypothetical protein